MARAAKAVLRKIDQYPFYEWKKQFQWQDDISKDCRMNWVCVDSENPKEFGCYDVTIEDCCSDTRLLNVALFRPKGEQWELLLDKHNYEGFRVVAWRDRGKPFNWEDLQ